MVVLQLLTTELSIAELGGSYSVLASGVTSPSYTAIELTAGVDYQFKVESRNSYGYSMLSDSITLLCAFKPDAPLTVSTINTADLVGNILVFTSY